MDRIKREGGKIKDSVLGKSESANPNETKKSGSDEAATETTER
jgi:hypothetical protein